MRKTYRVKRSVAGNIDRNQGGAGRAPVSPAPRRPAGSPSVARPRRKKGALRWPWAILCCLGMVLIIAMGVSSSKPAGTNALIKAASWTARMVSGASGSFATFFCFLIVLTSIMKLSKPNENCPRFLWGFWVLLWFASGIYHDFRVAWGETFSAALTGGGAGLTGACVDWFFRISLGRAGAITAMFFGALSGISLLLNLSFWAPFSYLWLGIVTAWQWFAGSVAHFFRPEGPKADDSDPEFDVAERAKGDISLADLLGGDKSKARDERSKSEEEAAATGSISSAAASMRERFGDKGSPEADDDFASTVKQQPLNEELFYEFPSFDMLHRSEPPKRPRSSADLEGRARVIEKTLLSFGVVAKVVEFSRGPAVTRYELQPGPGVKVASIVNLSQDLALALAAPDVRIEAPIPGKSAVGIEVPNKEVSLVHLRDVLETREFRTSSSPLTVALGKDISGRPVVTTLDHCLHLLIAGATGAGKSVCINSIIASLLFKARPDQVKLVLIDPKRVELSVWSRVPHLIAPVVSDPKKASGALRWATKEMEARYEKFTKVGTRDIERYNEVATPPGSVKPAMPYIVVLIDELSDLMMVAPAEVEDAIFRLAQMARASGIYLVVATQRPSVDVITGTIKANIPSRLAFAVASQIDSRTILDIAGAEKLLGRGDMLFSPVGSSKPLRAQGCYVSEREIDELVSFVSSQAKPQFAEGILAQPETVERESEVQDDPFFSQALRIVVEAKQASVSLLQRKLPIGYSRAARLIDAMETRGYVGPYEGSKPREVRMTIQEYMRFFEGGGPGKSTPAESPVSLPTGLSSRMGTQPETPARHVERATSAPASREDFLEKPSFLAKRPGDPGDRRNR